ncbi:hypothetical protein VTN96DRAFT_1096 [Rasamsonia emersonii]
MAVWLPFLDNSIYSAGRTTELLMAESHMTRNLASKVTDFGSCPTRHFPSGLSDRSAQEVGVGASTLEIT